MRSHRLPYLTLCISLLLASSGCGPESLEEASLTSALGTGAGLKGEYFDNMDLTGLKLTRTDATVSFSWPDGSSPSAVIGPDTFSVRWTGEVQPLYSETYTFYTQSDDGVRLWVNGVLLVDNWTNHSSTENSGTIALTAGQRYAIRMEYYENGWDAVAQLRWSSASQPKQIIPQTQLYAPSCTSCGTGLRGEYFDNMDLTALKLTRTDATVNFSWPDGSSPSAVIAQDTFSVRWTGEVQPLYSQTYTFYTQSDDGVRLWVNGVQLVNNWTNHSSTENSGTIALTAGQRYAIRMEYYENGWDAVAQLRWSSASQPKQIIPQTQLYPASGGSSLSLSYETPPAGTWVQPQQIVWPGSNSITVPAGYVHGGGNVNGYSLELPLLTTPPNSGWSNLTWRWVDTVAANRVVATSVAGRPAYRFTVNYGDDPFGQVGNATGRAELVASDPEAQRNVNRPDVNLINEQTGAKLYKWSTYFASGYPMTQRWATLLQFHPNNSDSRWSFGGMSVHQGYIDLARPFSDSLSGLARIPLQTGVWYDFALDIKWTSGSDGWVQWYVNGQPTGPRYTGPTLVAGVFNYLKLGYYRAGDVTTTGVVYHTPLQVR